MSHGFWTRNNVMTLGLTAASLLGLGLADVDAGEPVRNKYQPVAKTVAAARPVAAEMLAAKSAQALPAADSKTAYWNCRPVSYCAPTYSGYCRPVVYSPCGSPVYSSPVYSSPNYGYGFSGGFSGNFGGGYAVPGYGAGYGAGGYGAGGYGMGGYGVPAYSGYGAGYGSPYLGVGQPMIAPQPYGAPTIVDPFGAMPISAPAGIAPITPAYFGAGVQPAISPTITPVLGSPYFP